MSGFYVQHPRPHSAGAVSQELLKLDGDEGDRKPPLLVAKCHRSLFCSSRPGVHRIDRHTHDISWSETGETANPDLGRKRSSYSPPALHSHHQSPKYARTPDISLHTSSRPVRGITGANEKCSRSIISRGHKIKVSWSSFNYDAEEVHRARLQFSGGLVHTYSLHLYHSATANQAFDKDSCVLMRDM
jgi:hypothetical protein